MSTLLRNIFAASTLVALAACSSGVKLDDQANANKGQNTTDARSVASVNASADPLNDPNGVLAKRSVYFDFDSYSVKDDYKSMLENHAKYLTGHTTRKILVQGNTDERGTSEYNLALGQKRAEAVVRSLNLLGVNTNQLEAVSLGKEKPRAQGHDEASWAENRRADLAY
ncbi:peptidoglycan-associated lipoprotein [Pandoraea terrae]|uniref:Peptidoglycan-associated lipoprotein n=1 Tax=Pandoraea terrae TaxID=1537710 RepID=A0A5E4X629_9BURK|nr:peptidoglycan-associated lipoprotein Pal [Pandoraea terrae]VVE31692.1 peptidoglycan-associated lipoprotein [Pandoraea terrae]